MGNQLNIIFMGAVENKIKEIDRLVGKDSNVQIQFSMTKNIDMTKLSLNVPLLGHFDDDANKPIAYKNEKKTL